MKRILAFFRSLFSLGVVQPPINGVVADKFSFYGLPALLQNLAVYATREIAAITTSGTDSILTAAQAISSVVRLDSGASGGFTITLPTTAEILIELGAAIPIDGTFSKVVRIINNDTSQTGTLTAGDGDTTITGTDTIATDTARDFLLTVTSATTVTYENIGSLAL